MGNRAENEVVDAGAPKSGRRRRVLIVTVVVATAVAACSESGGGSPEPPPATTATAPSGWRSLDAGPLAPTEGSALVWTGDEVAAISGLERGRLWDGDPDTHEEM